MAQRARIIPTPSDIGASSSWHKTAWVGIRASELASNDRRMEGDVYLSSGHGIRLAIQGKARGWKPLGDLADIWMPNRLKGIQVSPNRGTPFLAAMTVFDARPTARKWLSLDRTADSESRFVSSGDILVTCSGTVGRTTLAYKVHEGKLITHDLLRVKVEDEKKRGWIYAYLHSKQVQQMATGAHYGQIIKHLEPSHLDALPVPEIDERSEQDFSDRFKKILKLRNNAHDDLLEAESKYAEAIGDISSSDSVTGYSISASSMAGRRRRLDGNYYSPAGRAIRKAIKKAEPLAKLTKRIWWEGRFKRFYGDAGIPYMSADELFTVNPADTKSILVRADDGHEKYFVQRGWILMACSGQVYGLNGAAILATEYDERAFFSHDLIRIIPDDSQIRAGYLLIALTHPTHGRPLLIRAAYGTSIPHLDPGDVADFSVARVSPKVEEAIADLSESSAHARATADAMERQLAIDADRIISDFTKRPAIRLVGDSQVATVEQGNIERFNALADEWLKTRPRGGDVEAMANVEAYKKVISMGDAAIRPILLRLTKKPEHWFVALNAITKQNPVPEKSQGRLASMADAWIEWGKERGYIGELD